MLALRFLAFHEISSLEQNLILSSALPLNYNMSEFFSLGKELVFTNNLGF